MKHIILYGHLAKSFGRHHFMDVRTPREAIRALIANFPSFRSKVLDHDGPGYHVRVGREYRDADGLAFPADDTIRVVPAVYGAAAVARIIIGAVLIVVGFWFQQPWMVKMGAVLVMGGVAELLFAPPKAESTEPGDSKPSYAFDGPVNTITQGNPVAICYGKVMVGSQVISASLSASDIAV